MSKVSAPEDLSSHYLTASSAQSAIAVCRLTGLESNTAYSYGVEVEGSIAPAKLNGRFQTFPTGAASFQFAFASCARTGSRHAVFDTIRKKSPLFFHHLGDMHYGNIAKNDRALYQAAFDTVFASPRQAKLYRNVPLVYVWDDHDFGTNNCDASTRGRQAARLTYQEYIPHYPLAAGSGDIPIYQSFNVGRVRFLTLDLRSERSPEKMPEGPSKTVLGEAQKAWLKQELLAAKANARLIFIVSSGPWIGRAGKDAGWAHYATERREIADFLRAAEMRNVCFLCGDAHMVAADDGSNSDFASSGGMPVPVLHGASLDRDGSYKGGPYSQGWYLPKKKESCFGWVEVEDQGTRIVVNYSGRNHRDEEKVSLRFEVAA